LILDGVSGFFIDINPSDRTMALGSTQPLTEMSTRGTSWGKGGRCVRLTTYHHPVPLSRNLGTLTSWNPLGLSRPAMGMIYLAFRKICSSFREVGYGSSVVQSVAWLERQLSRFVHSVKAAISTYNKTLFVIEFILQLTSK